MLFNSLEFLVFLPTVFVLYWLVLQRSLRGQNLLLLVASYVFYGWWDWRFLSLIVVSSTVDYAAGLGMARTDDRGRRRLLLLASLAVNLGLLGVFKYFDFFSRSLAELGEHVGWQLDPLTLEVVLPVGISFYTFQTLSYTIDVYRGRVRATSDALQFFAYVAFFPQLVAGPIERARNLLPQFSRPRSFSHLDGRHGLVLIGWGLFKKLVIADACAPLVDRIFADPASMSGAELVLGSVLFAFQIYGDFSGYSDIAIGTARLFGFELMVNFRTPYFSRDIAEFWRRWHISLSTWFRDYLYIPLGGSRGGVAQAVRNTFVIFVVSGLWHGANWTFVVWGGLNALYFLPLLLARRNRSHLDVVAEGRWRPSPREVLQLGVTFSLTCLAWVFFRAPSVSAAFAYLAALPANPWWPDASPVPAHLAAILVLWLLAEWATRRAGVLPVVDRLRAWQRYPLYYLLFLLLVLFGQYSKTSFIYFQF